MIIETDEKKFDSFRIDGKRHSKNRIRHYRSLTTAWYIELSKLDYFQKRKAEPSPGRTSKGHERSQVPPMGVGSDTVTTRDRDPVPRCEQPSQHWRIGEKQPVPSRSLSGVSCL